MLIGINHNTLILKQLPPPFKITGILWHVRKKYIESYIMIFVKYIAYTGPCEKM